MINQISLKLLPSPLLRGEGLGVRGYALSITIAIALTIMLGCCGCEPPKPSTREDYSAHAAVTLGHASIDSSPAPSPGPKPSDGKCKNCKGVGKVGDGRTMLTCDVCKGTGKDIADVIREREEKFGAVITCVPGGDYANDPEALAIPTLPYKPIEPPKQIELIETIKSIEQPVEPKPIEEPKQPKLISQPVETIPTIEMHSGDGCGPCKAWIATEMPKWQKAGWTVKVIKETKTSVGWPWFDITDRDGLRFSVYGPLTTDTFIAAKRPLLRLQLPTYPNAGSVK